MRPENQMGKMGLVFADVNNDDLMDIIAGSFIYLNPGNKLINSWSRVELPKNIDVYFSLNIVGDVFLHYWLKKIHFQYV